MFGTSSPFPLSLARLRKFTGKGPRYDYLASLASRSASFEKYDFNVKALDTTNLWTVTAHSTSTTWAVLAEPGGWIRGVTGASVATGAVQIQAPQKYWNGTKGAGMAALIRMSAVTNVRVEVGFADVLPAIGTTALNLASNAFNSIAAGAVYLYDEGVGASAAMSGLYTIGSSVAYGAIATTTNRYASGVTLFVMMEISGTTVRLWSGDGDTPVAQATGAVTAADGLLPFIMAKTQSGSKNIDIDCIWTWTLGRN